MAERRMFAKTIIDSDAFLDMPLSTQALYFHLSMRADDEGFVNNPKKISRMIGADDDSLKLLILKKFIIPFDSGVVVIKHWRMHNYIQKDRYKPTAYQEERKKLTIKENGAYTELSDSVYSLDTECIQDVSSLDTQVSIGKDSIGKDSIEIEQAKPKRHRYGEYNHVLLSDSEFQKLKDDFGEDVTSEYIRKVDEYCEQSGKTYKNYYLAIRNTFMKRDGIKAEKKKEEEQHDWLKREDLPNGNWILYYADREEEYDFCGNLLARRFKKR